MQSRRDQDVQKSGLETETSLDYCNTTVVIKDLFEIFEAGRSLFASNIWLTSTVHKNTLLPTFLSLI